MLEVFPAAEAPTASIIEDDTNPWSIVGVS
jgi:hypothetical protein